MKSSVHTYMSIQYDTTESPPALLDSRMGAVWLILGRTGCCDSPVLEGLPLLNVSRNLIQKAARHGGNSY